MNNFQLQKYKGVGSRYHCPQCNHKDSFALYMNSETKEPLSFNVGRCNRESKCGYHYPPREYFTNEGNGKRTFTPTSISGRLFQQKDHDLESRSFDTIDSDTLIKSLTDYENNNFVNFLSKYFSDQAVNDILIEYFVGTWSGGRTVFWQVDQKNKIRTGKLISYDALSGKRLKDRNPSWIHSELQKTKILNDFHMKQCFFGEHLLTKDTENKAVAIVESEKSAIIASLFFTNYIWLACGGKSNVSVPKLKTLNDRKVILFPDSDGFERWSTVVNEGVSAGLHLQISRVLENHTTPDEKEKGLDLADFIIADLEMNFDSS